MKITKTALKCIALISVICAITLLFTGCGGKDVTVKINDSGVETEIAAKTNMKIEDILASAEISLNEKDETIPARGEKLEEATEITVKRYAKVTIVNGKEKKDVELVGGTVKDAVEKADLNETDLMPEANENAYLTDGMVIKMTKATKITLVSAGKEKKISTFAATIKELLEEQKIKVDKDDELSHSQKEKIVEGMKVSVKKIEYKEETRTEAIPYSTEKQESSELSAGKTKVNRAGADGEKKVVYKVKYVDGKEDSKEEISSETVKEPVNEIVLVGKQSSSNSSPGGKTVASKQAVYDCNGSGHGYYVITYSDGSVEYEEF